MRFAFLVATGFFSLAAATASADSLMLASYGSTASAPAGVANTAMLYNGGASTYNLGTGGVWANAVGNSSWVSFDPGTAPGGGVSPKNGTYAFTTTFVDNYAASQGTITVMADDTASVYLNGFLVVAAADPATAGRCTIGGPNCTGASSFVLPTEDFLTGLNTLTFQVDQIFGNAEGVDFTANVSTAVTPEPSTLALLATGLLGVAVVTRRRLA